MRIGIGFLVSFSFVCSLGQSVAVASTQCEAWLIKNKILEAKTCSVACSNLPVDFLTVDCEGECLDFCKSSHKKPEGLADNIVEMYPGLTIAERELAKKHPSDALKAYKLSWEAEALCKNIYKTSDTNDESDACRHYIWAGLLVEQFSLGFTKDVLNAHESDPVQPIQEKKMDEANNEFGRKASQQLIADKKFSRENLIKQFKADLKSNALVVIRKKAQEKKEKVK